MHGHTCIRTLPPYRNFDADSLWQRHRKMLIEGNHSINDSFDTFCVNGVVRASLINECALSIYRNRIRPLNSSSRTLMHLIAQRRQTGQTWLPIRFISSGSVISPKPVQHSALRPRWLSMVQLSSTHRGGMWHYCASEEVVLSIMYIRTRGGVWECNCWQESYLSQRITTGAPALSILSR